MPLLLELEDVLLLLLLLLVVAAVAADDEDDEDLAAPLLLLLLDLLLLVAGDVVGAPLEAELPQREWCMRRTPIDGQAERVAPQT